MGRLVFLLRFSLGFAFIALASTLVILVALPLLPWRAHRIKLCNYYGKIVGRTIVFLTGAKPVFMHRERLDGSFPAIYVSNHCSTIDLFASMWVCPVGGCGISKKEIVRVPFFGWLYWLSGHLLIDRSDRTKAIAAMNEIAQVVREQHLGIWIWPEGTRSRTGRLQDFKKGFVHLAIATGLPVVPVVVHGAHSIWQKKALRFVPGELLIEVLPAIDTSAWRAEDAGAHTEEVHALFADALGPEQRPAAPDAPAPTSDQGVTA